MEYQEMKDRIFSEIEKFHDEAEKLNDYLACHPELSGEEFNTSRKHADFLQDHGFQVELPFADMETAFRGVYGNNNHRYKIALLTEYDALPGLGADGGPGHGCGHCLSGSMSILAALATIGLQDELDADIHIVGTPAEETSGGKCAMVEAGVFDDYDMAIMVHLYNCNLITPNVLAMHQQYYEFHGKPAHGAAAPWDGINAFNAAQLQFNAIDMIRQHVTPDVRMHGIIVDGGAAPNIVPDYVRSNIYVRAARRSTRDEVVEKVDNMAKGACMMTGCSMTQYTDDYDFDDLRYNDTCDAILREVYGELGIPINGDESALFGSSDIGNVSYKCPALHPCLQLATEDVKIHTKEFAALMTSDYAHDALDQGAKIIALTVSKIFGNPDRLAAMKADFADPNGKANK